MKTMDNPVLGNRETNELQQKQAVKKQPKGLVLPVFETTGEQKGRTITLEPTIFNITPHEHVLTLNIVNIRNRQRQGTAKTKEKSEVSASTRKIMRQKGTGNARKGSRKSNILIGGGRCFGPKPRSYGFKINKKEKKLAQKSALSIKAKQGQIGVIASVPLQKPSTKAYKALLVKMGVNRKKVLWVLPQTDTNMILSVSNVQRHKVTTAQHMNVYDLMNATKVLFLESALPMITQKFA